MIPVLADFTSDTAGIGQAVATVVYVLGLAQLGMGWILLLHVRKIGRKQGFSEGYASRAADDAKPAKKGGKG